MAGLFGALKSAGMVGGGAGPASGPSSSAAAGGGGGPASSDAGSPPSTGITAAAAPSSSPPCLRFWGEPTSFANQAGLHWRLESRAGGLHRTKIMITEATLRTRL